MISMNFKLMLRRKEFFFALLISLLIFLVPASINAIMLRGRDVATLAPAWGYFGAVPHIADSTLSSAQQIYFLFFFPFLVSMAFSSCAFDDKQAGINKLIIERSGRNNYYKSQAIVAFFSAFLIIFIPLLLSELAIMVAIPLYSNKITSYYPLEPDLIFRNVNFFQSLCYNHPYLYYFLYTIIGGAFGGLIGLLSYSISLHFKINRFLVITIPGIVYLVAMLLLNAFGLRAISPDILIVPPTNTEGIKLEYLLIFGGSLLLANLLAIWSKIHLTKDEL